jgi:V/A-type H+-transporting ATPase subunit C
MNVAGMSDLNPLKKGVSPHFREGKTRELPAFVSVSLRRIRPFHDVTRYGYAVGMIRVLETQMLTSQHIERLVDADYDGALHILDETDIGDYLHYARLTKEVDAGLTAFLRDVYDSLEKALPKDSFLMDFFRCRFDFHNLKALLKAEKEGKEPEALLEGLGAVGIETLKAGLENPAALPSPYKETVEELAGGWDTSQQLDTVVDKHYLQYRLFLAKREDSPFMVDFARAAIDLANLKLLLRGRILSKERDFMQAMLAGGGFIDAADLLDLYGDAPETMMKRLEAKVYYSRMLELVEDEEEIVRLTEFDRRSDDHLMEMVRDTKRISLGVEPIFAYVRARENEALMVRIILEAKLHRISPDAIEKMLRKLYID